MPYIIETRTPRRQADSMPSLQRHDVSRTAVTTLDEARKAVWGPLDWRGTCEHITAKGGTIGPLSDGTVIEVAQVTPVRLAELAGTTSHLQSGQAKLTSLIVAKFNKAHA